MLSDWFYSALAERIASHLRKDFKLMADAIADLTAAVSGVSATLAALTTYIQNNPASGVDPTQVEAQVTALNTANAAAQAVLASLTAAPAGGSGASGTDTSGASGGDGSTTAAPDASQAPAQAPAAS
jgi:hypothetical protein